MIEMLCSFFLIFPTLPPHYGNGSSIIWVLVKRNTPVMMQINCFCLNCRVECSDLVKRGLTCFLFVYS